jgi:hypothetical protein
VKVFSLGKAAILTCGRSADDMSSQLAVGVPKPSVCFINRFGQRMYGVRFVSIL